MSLGSAGSSKGKGIASKSVTFRVPGDVELAGVCTDLATTGSVPMNGMSEMSTDGNKFKKTTSTKSIAAGQRLSNYASATASSARRQAGEISSTNSGRPESDIKQPLNDSSIALRRGRLPWLDGNQSRQFSVPRVPGAFVDDDILPSKSPKEVTAHQNKWKYDLPMGADATVSTTTSSGSRPVDDSVDSGTAVVAPGAVASTPLNRQLSNQTAQRIASRVVAAPAAVVSPTQPAIPLAALASQLHFSDSTVSDAESAKAAHPQDLSDASDSGKQNITTTPATPPAVHLPNPAAISDPAPAKAVVTQAGPEYSDSPSVLQQSGITGLQVTAGNRKVSFTVQPIRQDRLQPEALPNVTDSHRSLSVQPVRAKTWKELQTPAPDHDRVAVTAHDVGNRETVDPVQEALRLARQAAENHKMQEAHSRGETAAIHHSDHRQEHALYYEQSVTTHTSSSTSVSKDEDPAPMLSLPGLFRSKDQHSSSAAHHPMSASAAKSSQARPKPAALSQPGVRTVWDEDWPHHRVNSEHPSVETHLPGNEVVISSAHDWSSTTPVRLSKNVQLPAVPPAAQQSNRDQVHLVNRGVNGSQSVQSTAVDGPPAIPARKSSLADHRTVQIEPVPALARHDEEPDSPGHGEITATGTRVDSSTRQWGSDKFDEKDYENYEDRLKGQNHLVLREGEQFHLAYKPQPIARNWGLKRKRWTAFVACLNTALIGMLIGIYAGEVPAIQYALADRHHRIILGNVVLYLAIGLVVLIFWPLPLLHGRRPYTLTGLAVALPPQIPQAVIVGTRRGTEYSAYIAGLLICRALTGIALGFVHINLISTLLDLYGASLQSDKPHGEIVVTDDIRRHGGGVGLWLGFWSWCFIGSLAIGFLVGAEVVSGMNISWGFYISVILIAIMLLLNVITPETRRRPHRRTMQEVELPDNTISTRVARGEIKMHVYGDGPKWWWEEVLAGLYLSFRMLRQSGFLLMAIYLAWIYAQIVLIIVLLGNLLSANYRWRPEYVGLGVFGIAVGALLAIPSSKANIFSMSRRRGPRTDSMTIQPKFSWSSHFIRRLLFMTALPVAGLAYTLSSKGRSVQYMVPVIFASLIGYISNLAISECNGIIMETFDTCDLQPGVNNRHRLQSLPADIKRKRTTYSSYPRVSAGLFTTQGLAYLLAAASVGVGGKVTRAVGAQKATAITAGILLGLTILLTVALIRYKTVQVIPNELFGHYFGSQSASPVDPDQRRGSADTTTSDRSWRAVIIGNPSGKDRRMNWLELGSLSRWTEVRRLNRLLNRSTTQALNPGWQ